MRRTEPSVAHCMRIPVSRNPAVLAEAQKRGHATVAELGRVLCMEAANVGDPNGRLVTELAQVRSALIEAVAVEKGIRPAVLRLAEIIVQIERAHRKERNNG